ncbi:MAG: NAD(P)-dependent alcohol dehydrogenase, partial [Acidobacteriota bacterium]
MQALEIQSAFGLDHLVMTERDEPEPGHGQVRLRMRAASLNYRDVLMVTGRYDPRQTLPLVPCSDGVGIVEAVGPGVDRVAVGDRVATLFSQKWLAGEPDHVQVRATLGGPLDGVLAEAIVLDQDGVSRVPDYLTDIEAATLPCAALTAWSALVTHDTIDAGDVVLVQGTGGVSLFALQIGRALGARVVVTSSKDEKLERARQLGSWREINYVDDPKWSKAVRAMTDGIGVDHVVEVGGAETLNQSLRAVRIGGQISLIGVLSGVEATISLPSILMNQVRVQGILVGNREGFEAMCRAFEAHAIHPVIDRVFPFAEA